MRHKANMGVYQEMRLQIVATSPVDGSVTIDEFELRDCVIRAVNDDLERTFAVYQTVFFHVALNDRTQVVDACFALISIERGGENFVLTAVEIDAQKNRLPLEIRKGEHIGNGRSGRVARGIIVKSHKQKRWSKVCKYQYTYKYPQSP